MCIVLNRLYPLAESAWRLKSVHNHKDIDFNKPEIKSIHYFLYLTVP